MEEHEASYTSWEDKNREIILSVPITCAYVRVRVYLYIQVYNIMARFVYGDEVIQGRIVCVCVHTSLPDPRPIDYIWSED